MIDVTDGKYVGPLTPDENIEQYEYRADIHWTYIELMAREPGAGWEAYGTKEWHLWAINGYERGIRNIRENNPIEYRCNLNEALNTISRYIVGMFRKK